MSLDQEINAIVDMKIQQLIEIMVKVSPHVGEQVLEEYRKLSYYQAKKSVQVEVSAFDTIIDPEMEYESGFVSGKGILTPSDVHFDYACEADDSKFNFNHDGFVETPEQLQLIIEEKPYLFGFDERTEDEIEAQITELENEVSKIDEEREEWNKKFDLVMSETVK